MDASSAPSSCSAGVLVVDLPTVTDLSNREVETVSVALVNTQVPIEFAPDKDLEVSHHDFKVLPNGNLIILAMETKTAADCIAAFSYVFDHATRDLASRLTQAHHDQHDLSVASLHVHLDHESCLEVSVLRGATGSVTAFADTLATQRGVRHAHLHLIPVRVSAADHAHGERSTAHGHLHA